MRRREREVTDINEIESIIHESSVCRLGLVDGDKPYVVPLCFGYFDNTLFFHSAKKGYKLDLIKKNNRVCFEFDTFLEIKKAAKPCSWGMLFRSVIGFGKAALVDDTDSKRRAFDIIMKNYSDGSYAFSEADLKNTVVIKVKIESMTGKQII